MKKCKLLVSQEGYEKGDIAEIIKESENGTNYHVFVKNRTSTSYFYPLVSYQKSEVELLPEFKDGIWAEVDNTPIETKLFFGDVEFTIRDGYADTSFGKVTIQEVENALDFLENPPTLAGHTFTIHKESYHNFKDIVKGNTDLKIGFGCKSGTYEELKAIQTELNK